MAINLDAPMTWHEFRNLEKEEQREYLQHLIDTYGANAVSFGKMFHVGAQTVRKHIVEAGLGITLNRGSRVDKVRWNEFLGIADEEESQGPAAGTAPAMQIRSATLHFAGKIDVDTIAAELRRVFDGNTQGQIEISFTVGTVKQRYDCCSLKQK